MADANQELFDAALRHQIGVRRFSTGEVRRALAILNKADRELVEKLRRSLAKLAGKPVDFKSQRYMALIKDLRELRRVAMVAYRQQVRDGLLEFATSEADFEQRILQGAIPVELSYATVAAATLRASVISQPFAGGANAARTLQQWFDTLLTADQRRLVDAINLGLTQQETVDDIVRRVVGTRAANYADGVLAITRRNAEAVVRTAINHVSNVAREEVWKANDDIIGAFKWNATLDGRTSTVCRARDGHFAVLGDAASDKYQPRLKPETARPPAHPNCRSVMVAVLDPDGIAEKMGVRPFVRDTRTRRKREIDFRAEAKEAAGSNWKSMTTAQRNAAIRNRRRAWTEENIGQVPADVDYDTWLRRQPTTFQNEVLGVKKAQAFRKGLRLDQFIDVRGRELTLVELRTLFPDFVS